MEQESMRMSDGRIDQVLGMNETQLYQYLEELLRDEAAEASVESGETIEEELKSAGFAAVGAAATYAIKLIEANNAFITRQLLDAGVLNQDEEPT